MSSNWRIVFRFEDGRVLEVDLVDYRLTTASEAPSQTDQFSVQVRGAEKMIPLQTDQKRSHREIGRVWNGQCAAAQT